MPDWLVDTRTSYDTVAVSYADHVRDALTGQPYLRAALALFADLVRAAGGGPVADVGCGPGHVTAQLPGQVAAWLRDAGFTIEAQLLLDSDQGAPGAMIFARRES